MESIYADWAATAPLHPAAAAVLSRWLQNPVPANPSSVHRFGMDAADLLEKARETLLSAMVGGDHGDWQLTFTSGGTEGAALAVWSLLSLAPFGRRRILLSPQEHSAVREAVRFFGEQGGYTVEECRVSPSGVVDLVDLTSRLGEDVALLAVMTVQNETGVIQPIAECAALAHRHGALFFSDAVQAAGHIPLPVLDFPDRVPDILSLSAHKFGGLPGAGTLLHRVPLSPLQKGGGQERGLRGGTENLPGILAMAAAVSGWEADFSTLSACNQAKARREEAFLHRMREAGIPLSIAGADSPRLSTTSLVVFRDIPDKVLPLGENIVLSADLAGLAISAGSACHSSSPLPSSALLAMGYTPTEARRAVRLSFGMSTSSAEQDAAWRILGDVVCRLYAR